MIKLTKKQAAIAEILCHTGESDAQIAYEVGISVPTVKMHMIRIRDRIHKQVGVLPMNRTQIVIYLIQEGFYV